MMPIADPNSENAPVARNSTPNQRPTIASSRCASIRQKRDVVRQVRLAEQRRVRKHRRKADRDDRHEHEAEHLLDVRESPPASPPRHVRGRRLEDVACRRRCLCERRAGDRAHEPRHVLPHAESFVAYPVALAEILPAARTGKGDGAEDQRDAQTFGNRAEARRSQPATPATTPVRSRT